MDFIHEIEKKKSFSIVLSGVGQGLMGRDSGSDLLNVQYKPIGNFHNESPLYNKYTLLKINEEKDLLSALKYGVFWRKFHEVMKRMYIL
jgi:hypothetical protein